MPRVLHVICDLSAGGAERMVVELVRRRSPDFEVEVATIQGGGPLEVELRAAGVPVWLGRRRGARGLLSTFGPLVAAAARADIVHTHLYAGDVWGRAAAVVAGIGHGRRAVLLSTEHNFNPDEGWRVWVKRATAPATRVVVAVSEAVAVNAVGHERVARPSQIRVIPNGVDVARFVRVPARSPSAQPLRLLAVGRCVPQKGFDLLIDALPPGVTLRIAGDGPFRREHPQVEWVGRVADVAPLYAAADIVVVPSRWEGFGLVAAEAMAARCVVVASAVGGLPEVVGDAGVLVPPGDVGALRAALSALVADRPRCAQLAAAGRLRAVSRFDIVRCVRAYEDLYRELLDGRQPLDTVP